MNKESIEGIIEIKKSLQTVIGLLKQILKLELSEIQKVMDDESKRL